MNGSIRISLEPTRGPIPWSRPTSYRIKSEVVTRQTRDLRSPAGRTHGLTENQHHLLNEVNDAVDGVK
ncbi:hypothetical protein halTADL_2645 [Halohasta litchfieldiae]|uniref:Uncharacterized protein n=1 Tax=Halohasta litchfieldiae TaxID=1073996 RepID=A0A1H6VZA8_9EURY|nr:hypothetical protein halTADL_2645 [Halohasta litchfieldiae]SEJ05910.1 hypothetical protein SAMN05444271_11863 [Halohasta litchfieldiae]